MVKKPDDPKQGLEIRKCHIVAPQMLSCAWLVCRVFRWIQAGLAHRNHRRGTRGNQIPPNGVDRRWISSPELPNQTGGGEHRKNHKRGREALSRRTCARHSFKHGLLSDWLRGDCLFRLKQGRLRGRAMLFIREWTGVKLGHVSPNGKVDPKLVPVTESS